MLAAPAMSLYTIVVLPIVNAEPSASAQDALPSTPVIAPTQTMLTEAQLVSPPLPPLASPEPARFAPALDQSGPLPPPPARAEGSDMDTPSARASMTEVEQVEVIAAPRPKSETAVPIVVPGLMPPAEGPDELIVTPPVIEQGGWKQAPAEAEVPETSARVQMQQETGDGGAIEGKPARGVEIGPQDAIAFELDTPEQPRRQTEKASLRISAQPDAPTRESAKTTRGEAPASEENGTIPKPQASAIPHNSERPEAAARLMVLEEQRPERETKTLENTASNRESRGEAEVLEPAGQFAMPGAQSERTAEVRSVVQRHVLGLEAVALLHQIESAAQRATKLSRVTVHLRPPDLGTINISVESREGSLSARFTASHPLVAAWLETNVGTLRTHLTEAGLPFGEVNCSLTSDQHERGWAGERPEQTWSSPKEGTTVDSRAAKSAVTEQVRLADWRA